MVALQPVVELIPILLQLLDLDLQFLAPSSPLLLLLLQLLQTKTQKCKPMIPGEGRWCTMFHFKPHEHANIPRNGSCPNGCVSLLSRYRCFAESIAENNDFWEFYLFSYWILSMNSQYGFQIKKTCPYLWKENVQQLFFQKLPKLLMYCLTKSSTIPFFFISSLSKI